MFEAQTHRQGESRPSKAAKTDSIFAQEIFSALARRAVFLIQYLLLLCWACSMRLLHFISFLCIVFHTQELGFCFCGLIRMKGENLAMMFLF